MPSRHVTAFLAVTALASSGCATMSESECQYADWRQLGVRDARDGRAADYFADRAGACSEYGMAADREAYRAGWRLGLEDFCTPDSGFRYGLDGEAYRSTCPAARERPFLAGYELGRDIHGLADDIDSLDREIASMEDELDDLEDRDGDEADRLEREIRDRRHRIRELERDLGRLEAIAAERGFPISRY